MSFSRVPKKAKKKGQKWGLISNLDFGDPPPPLYGPVQTFLRRIKWTLPSVQWPGRMYRMIREYRYKQVFKDSLTRVFLVENKTIISSALRRLSRKGCSFFLIFYLHVRRYLSWQFLCLHVLLYTFSSCMYVLEKVQNHLQ